MHPDLTRLPAAVDLRAYLHALYLERMDVRDDDMADLDGEIAACRWALAGAKVIEIARGRAEAVGPQTG